MGVRPGAAIDRLFHPRSIALIGASRRADARSSRVLARLIECGYAGEIFPVNPNADSVVGLRCYPSVLAIDKPIDVALLMVPTSAAIAGLRESARQGVRSAIVFGGVPGSPVEFNRQVAEVVAEFGIRVVGPNCVGTYNIRDRIPLGYGFPMTSLPARPGLGTAIVGQSGGMLTSIAVHATELGVGLTHFASLGNEADLRFDDFLEWLLLEPDVRVVIAYLEQIRRPDRLIELADVARHSSKSIVLLRVGQSATASRIALTHTGSIVGSLAHEEAFLEEIGVHVVHGINEAAAVASALRRPARRRGGAAIVATTGGLSATFADLAHNYRVVLPDLEPPVYQHIRGLIEPFDVQDADVSNPVDLGAPGQDNEDIWLTTLDALLGQDSIAMGLSAVAANQADRALRAVKAARSHDKPMAFFVFDRAGPPGPLLGPFVDIALDGVPVFASDAECLRGIAAMLRFAGVSGPPRFLRTAETLAAEAADEADVPAALDGESATKSWLAHAGVPIPAGEVVVAFDAGLLAAERIGFPVVLKVSDPRVVHKTEAGGVATHITNRAELGDAWRSMVARLEQHGIVSPAGFLVEEEVVSNGPEWLIGVRNDFGFGPLVTVGAGGIQTEAVRDFAVAPAPVDRDFAASMVRSLRTWQLLTRREVVSIRDLEPLANLVALIGELSWYNRAWLAELDLNPVVVVHDRAVALDARVSVRAPVNGASA